MARSKTSQRYNADVIVIGSGAGGAVAAQTLANAGKRVIIIEESKLGGSCAHQSCIPTRALLETATTARLVGDASRYGITTGKTKIDFADVMHWQKKAVHKTGVASEDDAIFTSDNIRVISGRAHFIDTHTVSVHLTRYSAPNFIIATGASPYVPAIEGLSDSQYVTYKNFENQTNLPKSVAIIGGGATTYEYAQIYRAFGTTVHVFESHYHLFSSFDSEIGDLADNVLSDIGVRVHTSSKITSVTKTAKSTVISFMQDGQTHHVSVDGVFVATGHTPNLDIGLENALITYTGEGIRHNKRLQTSQQHIYAVGDVTGMSHSASSAVRQGLVAAHNILHRKKVTFDTRAVPKVAYGLPEILVVGKTEREVKLTGLPYQTSIAPLGVVGRSFTSAYSSGFVKIVATHEGIVIGASIIAPHAVEFGQELTFAIQHHHRACDIANTIHPFSSWSEAVRVAASKIYCI